MLHHIKSRRRSHFVGNLFQLARIKLTKILQLPFFSQVDITSLKVKLYLTSLKTSFKNMSDRTAPDDCFPITRTERALRSI